MKKQKTVLLGMSGGVDSSIAALLLKKQGYKVIGVFLKMFSDTKNLQGECNYLEELKSAQKIAIKLNIPLHTIDFEKQYRSEVLNPMFESYGKGLTPNPDIACNAIIKFPLLWKEAKKYKADYIATGHYARIKKKLSSYHLLQGKDKSKDQSYFLAELTQEDLQHTLFPIGNYTKEQVRKIARQNNFSNWDKHGSVGICFVGQVSMQSFLKQKLKEKQGMVKDPQGKVLGNHLGIHYYTIGQKVGDHIGINIQKSQKLAQKRFYIAEKKPNNTLVVAPEGHPILKKKEIIIKKLHLINPKEKIPKINLKARIRHLGQLHPGKLVKKSNRYHFILNKSIEGVAEGQFIVLYHKERIIGSGEIRLK